jgi:hypothetical protein
MRALTEGPWPSPFIGPILFMPVDANLPPSPPLPPTAIDVDTPLVPVVPAPAEETRGAVIPEARPRDVGARRLDGRRKPVAPAADTLDDDGAACATICLLR